MSSRFLLGSQRSNPAPASNNTPTSPRENNTASNPIPISNTNNSQGAQAQPSQNTQPVAGSPSKQFQTSTVSNQSTPPKRGFQLGSYRPPGEGVWNTDEENKLKELSERQAEVERKLQEIALKQQQLKSGTSSGDNSARSSTAETSTEPRTPPPSRASDASSTASSAVESPRTGLTPRGQVPNLAWQNSPRAASTSTSTPSNNTSNPTSPRQMAPKQIADDDVSAMSGRVANPPVPTVSSNPASGSNSPGNWRKSSASSGTNSSVVSTTRSVSPTRAAATSNTPAPTTATLSTSGSFRGAVPRLSLSRSRLPIQTRLSFSRSTNVSTSMEKQTTTSSTTVDPAETPADPAFDDLLADLERPIHEGVMTANAIQVAKDLDVQALIPDSVFIMERKCLLLTLQVRMLLREMTEYKLKSERMKNGNLSIDEMQNILALSPDQTDDKAWILEIGELKRMIIQENRKNYTLEQELKKLEKKISLLIANRTSIQELDRQERKAKTKTVLESPRSKIDLLAPKRVEIYSHLFYLLQTEPGYLANLTFLVQSDSVTKFLDTILLTMFGHSFAPREEYLLLKLFYLAVLKEIKHLKSDINELTQTDSIIPKMLITYNKRKQGVEFLKSTLGIFLKKFLAEDYEFELKPLAVYHGLAKQQGKTNTDISVEELNANSEVQDILQQRVAQLTKVCDEILKIAIDNVNSVPYGLRLICKQIMASAQARFPKANQQDILKVIGYYVFYRFMNLIIVTPEAFDIEAPAAGKRKNLITISIVLQRLFNLDLFPSKNVMTPLNDWITKNIPNVESYFKTLMDVTDPEEYLQVNKYMDLYSTEKPFIIISLEEITEIHALLYRHLGQLAPEANDPLRIIMADLGDVPTLTESQKDTEVQLTLENRFKDLSKNILDDDSNINVRYEQTVDYVVKILGAIVKIGKKQHTLMDVLGAARDYANASNDKILQSLVTKTEENLKILTEHNKVDPEKNYAEFLRDVAFKVVNRTNRREQQLKELERLRLAYKNIMKYQGYLNNQLMEYQKYLISCRQNVYRNSKHRKKMVQKFHFKELVKRGVIEMGEGEMSASEKKINLFIKMLDPIENGTFDIEAKLAGLVVAKLKLELDDLLDKKETGINSYEMDNLTLNVPETLFLLNKYFLS